MTKIFNRSSSMVDNELIRMNHRKTDYSTITPSQMEGTRKVRQLRTGSSSGVLFHFDDSHGAVKALLNRQQLMRRSQQLVGSTLSQKRLQIKESPSLNLSSASIAVSPNRYNENHIMRRSNNSRLLQKRPSVIPD